MEIKYARDIYGKGWYINSNYIIYAKKIEDSNEIFKLTGKNELKKCYILHMIDGEKIILENML